MDFRSLPPDVQTKLWDSENKSFKNNPFDTPHIQKTLKLPESKKKDIAMNLLFIDE